MYFLTNISSLRDFGDGVTYFSTNIPSLWDCTVNYLCEQIAVGRKPNKSQNKVPQGRDSFLSDRF
jgi:hypothetical protein